MAKRTDATAEQEFVAPAKALFNRAISFIDTPRKHWASLQRLYRWVIQSGLKHPAAHYNYGRNLQEHGRFEEAAEQYRKAIELKPDYAMAYNNLGTVLCELGRYSECEKALCKAIEIEDGVLPHNNLAELYRRTGQLDLARSELERARSFDPANIYVIYTLAQVHEDAREYAEAEDWYRKALELDDGNAALHRDIGSLLVRLGRRGVGERHLRRAEDLEAAANHQCRALKQWRQQSRTYHQRMRRKKKHERKR